MNLATFRQQSAPCRPWDCVPSPIRHFGLRRGMSTYLTLDGDARSSLWSVYVDQNLLAPSPYDAIVAPASVAGKGCGPLRPRAARRAVASRMVAGPMVGKVQASSKQLVGKRVGTAGINIKKYKTKKTLRLVPFLEIDFQSRGH